MTWRGSETMKFKVELEAMIFVPASSDVREVVETHLDEVMSELVGLSTEDASIELDLTPDIPEVTFSVVVESSNPLAAAHQASGLIRGAIHGAGGYTPDWPGAHDDAWAVTLTGVSSSRVDHEAPDTQLVDA